MVCIDFPNFSYPHPLRLSKKRTRLAVQAMFTPNRIPLPTFPASQAKTFGSKQSACQIFATCILLFIFFPKTKTGGKKKNAGITVTFKSFLKEIKGRMMQESYNDSPQEPRCSGSVAPFGRSHLGCCNNVDTCHAIPYQKLPFRPRCCLKHTRSPWRYARSGAQKNRPSFGFRGLAL